VLIFGERDHAVADVAGGKHFEVFAETAGGATVVGDGDDGGEVVDEAGVGAEDGGDAAVEGRGWGRGGDAVGDVGGTAGGGGSGDVALEAAQEGGEAGASADGDDAEGGWGRPGGGGWDRFRVQERFKHPFVSRVSG